MLICEEVKKDITTVTRGIVVHGCNNRGVMGSGVAKAIRDKWPDAYATYRSEYEKSGLELGTCVVHRQTEELYIVNAITQDGYGYDGRLYFRYETLVPIFSEVSNLSLDTNLPIYIPKIGAGLGGGDWAKIETAIKDILNIFCVESLTVCVV